MLLYLQRNLDVFCLMLNEMSKTTIKAAQKQVTKFAVANISKAENLRTNYRAWSGNLNVDFDLKIDDKVNEKDFPKEPTREFEVINQHVYNVNVAHRCFWRGQNALHGALRTRPIHLV